MSLSSKQFAVLTTLAAQEHPLTQRAIAEQTGLGIGTVNTIVREAQAAGYVTDRALTEAGRAALEPYRVTNAVILAAGLSQRFAPISYEKPKGLLLVRDEILIERQIAQLQAAGITDITIVVGYKQEHFFYLEKKLGVKIAVNDEYATKNNHSSLWVVREKLDNTYICSSDNYFTENPFESYVYRSYYSAEFIAGETDEWCLVTGPKGRITGVTIGGHDSWVMMGHVYFDRSFSETFRGILEREYPKARTASKLWEHLYVEHIDELPMVKREYAPGVVNEFDSLDEVQGFDPDFIENVDSEVFDNIVATLGVAKTDVSDFYPLKQGITNLSCHFSVGDDEYVYRHPGVGTEKMIDRSAEFAALSLANDLGIDRTFMTMDPRSGWKISHFISDAREIDPHNTEQVARAMQMLHRLHRSGASLTRTFDFVSEGTKYEQLLREHGPIDVPGYDELREKVMRLKAFADDDGFDVLPSHNDAFYLNFLLDPEDDMVLIDWEYAGMSDEANDFGTFVVCGQLSPDEANAALDAYFGRPATERERRHFWAYVVFAGWCWYIWSLAKEAEGDNIGEWLYIYYRHAVDYIDEVLAQYELAVTA